MSQTTDITPEVFFADILQADEVAPPEFTFQEALQFPLTFGKHKGRTLGEIAADPIEKNGKGGIAYIRFITEWTGAKETQRAAAQKIVDEFEKVSKKRKRTNKKQKK